MFTDVTAGVATGWVRDASAKAPLPRWSEARIWAWYRRQPWLLGANYVPASAGNQIDMWSAEGFDEAEIDRELGWAASLGMNTLRVFLIDTLWSADAAGFAGRIDRFLELADRRGIRPLLVLFDSCWNDDPALDVCPMPMPGVHNHRWLQSPGQRALLDRGQWERLRAYVEGVIATFGQDRRVLGWDLWNEPCNPGNPHRENQRREEKYRAVAELLPQVYGWARAMRPVQPLTSGLWQHDDWAPGAALTEVERIQLELSDFVSFHDYGGSEQFLRRLRQLQAHGRPVVCTEWLARTAGSTIEAILPSARFEGVGMFNWGLVAGRTQTTLPWDSWVSPYEATPEQWFHDLLRADGTPFDEVEAALMRELAAADRSFERAARAA